MLTVHSPNKPLDGFHCLFKHSRCSLLPVEGWDPSEISGIAQALPPHIQQRRIRSHLYKYLAPQGLAQCPHPICKSHHSDQVLGPVVA